MTLPPDSSLQAQIPKSKESVWEVYRHVILLALPAVAGTASQPLMNIVDVAMVGRLGPEALAAAALGNLIAITAGVAVGGLGVGIQSLVARRFGEERFEECGAVLSNGVLLTLLFGIPITLFVALFADSVFALFVQDPAVLTLGIPFLRIRVPGVLCFCLVISYRSFFNGIGKTKVYMVIAIVMNIWNAIWDYLLIFGVGPFPKLGVTGAAVGTTSAMGLGALLFFLTSLHGTYRRKYMPLHQQLTDRKVQRDIIHLSFPAAVENISVVGSYLLFQTIVGHIGTVALAASHVCVQLYSFAFIPSFGFGYAAATLVGQNLGRKDPERAEWSAWAVVRIALSLLSCLSLTFLIFPQAVLSIFSTDAAVIALGCTALRIISISMLLDALGIILTNALYGAGNTRWVMVVHSFSALGIFLPCAWLFGVHLQGGLGGAWMAHLTYILIFTVALVAKFRRGEWKEMAT